MRVVYRRMLSCHRSRQRPRETLASPGDRELGRQPSGQRPPTAPSPALAQPHCRRPVHVAAGAVEVALDPEPDPSEFPQPVDHRPPIDGPEGRRQIGGKPAAGGRGAPTPLRSAGAVASLLTGRGPRRPTVEAPRVRSAHTPGLRWRSPAVSRSAGADVRRFWALNSHGDVGMSPKQPPSGNPRAGGSDRSSDAVGASMQPRRLLVV